MKAVTIILTILLVLSVTVSAQDTDQITVSTEIVNVSVAVTGRDGKAVGNLTKNDFELFDNKKKAEIEFFSTIDAPVSYGIVYDLHPSTSDQTRSILRALDAFTKGLGQHEDFFLTIFNEYGSLNLNFVPTEDQIKRHLSFGERNEPNSLYDAVFYAGNKLRPRANQKKTLIIISDGKDNQSHHSFKELERLFDSFSVQIYSVILDKENEWDYGDLTSGEDVKRVSIDESMLDKAAIRSLSSDSGGTSSSPQSRNAVDLYKIFESISFEMRGRYFLGFYPSSGESHEIELRLIKKTGEKVNLSYQKSFRLAEQP
jgi:VWFA-related protein